MTAPASFLLLADSRLPTGAHAHSGGMEEAVACGAVRAVSDLEPWLRGRLHTVGLLDAACAAAAHACTPSASAPGCAAGWGALDAEWSARTPSPALRAAGRAQGRGLLRAARASWPGPLLDGVARELPLGAPWPVALGAAGRAAGAGRGEVAVAAATAAVTGPAWATTRLLGTDPYAVAAVLAALGPAVDAVAAEALAPTDALAAAAGQAAGAGQAAAGPSGSLAGLPAWSAPLVDLGAERHAAREVRLFAS